MREKRLLIIINIIALLCLAVFVFARFEKMPISFLDQEKLKSENIGEYGDLYYMCMVDYFKVKTPLLQSSFISSEKNYNANDADIIIFGDSYFASSRVLKNFPELIADSMNLKVHSESQSLPIRSLNNNKYIKGKRKYLIYEATERRILEDFKNTHKSLSESKQIFSNVLTKIVPYNLEFNYQYILQNSIISSKLYSFVMNTRYDLFGLISEITPVYSTNPIFLFYYQNVNNKNTSFYYRFTDKELTNVADNIQKLAIFLMEEYNLELIFLPIPSSYTINHKILNNDKYNNLLPRLHEELNKRNIKNINLYTKFIKSNKLLYFPTDTHWNDEGMKIAFIEVKNLLSN